MKNYLQDLKYKWNEFDLKIHIVKWMYCDKNEDVYVDVIEDYKEYKEPDHGNNIKSIDIRDDRTLHTYEDGTHLISGFNKHGQIGLGDYESMSLVEHPACIKSKELKAECEEKILKIIIELKNTTDCIVSDINIEDTFYDVIGSDKSIQTISEIDINLETQRDKL